MTSFDPMPLRALFPALAQEQAGRPLVYLDGPGGTQVPRSVIDAVSGYYQGMNANEGGSFVTSRRSDEMHHEAHAAAADLLGAASPDEIVFGANMTTITFHMSRSIGATLTPGDEILVTTLDHEANVSPWQALAADRDLVVRTVDIRSEDGTLDLDDLDRKLGPRTRLVALGYASNALGTINPVSEVVRRARAAGALTWVDAVHFAPHGPLDVQALDVDFLVCSAYKWFGPHVGVLYARSEHQERLPTYKVRPSSHRFSTGTPNLEGIAGTLAAIEYIASIADGDGRPPLAHRGLDDRRRRVRAHALEALPRRRRDAAGGPGLGHRRRGTPRRAHAHVRDHIGPADAPRDGGTAGGGGHPRVGRSLLCHGAHRAPGAG